MNNYDFQFAERYIGYWNIPNIGRKIPGTLFLEKHSIRLELFWNNTTSCDLHTLPSATGYAYTDRNNKKQCYYFTLKDLHLYYVSLFGKHQSQYKFDVYNLYLSDKPRFSTNGVLNCCIRTSLMDKWLWDYTQGNYENFWPFKEEEIIEIKYHSKPSLTLYDSPLYHIYIKSGFEAHTPNAAGFNMTTNCFLNIELKKKHQFYDALDLTESIVWLFSLLWKNQFIPDFIEFRTSKSKFIYKQSDRFSYKYRDVTDSNLATLISDYNEGELNEIIEKWLNIVGKDRYSIGTFFETQFNEHSTPSSILKNYVSVVDGLSRDFRIPTTGQSLDSSRSQKYEGVFKKIKPVLSPNEFNVIKMAVLRESPTELKPRFARLLDLLSKYVNIELDSEFGTTVVNTRNLITHSKTTRAVVFSKDQYSDVDFCLEKLIMAYLLFRVGVTKSVAQKIIGKIGLK